MAATGVLRRSPTEWIWYCGVWIVSGYCTPVCGLTQKVGVVWKVPASEISTFCATFCADRFNCCIRVRSM